MDTNTNTGFIYLFIYCNFKRYLVIITQVSQSFNFKHYKLSSYEDNLLTKITERNQNF